MKGGDGGREKGECFQLPNCGDEATGTGGRAGAGHHIVEGGGEGITMGQLGVLGMKDGKGSEVAEVGVGGTSGPRADGSCNGVNERGAASGLTEELTEQGEVVRAKLLWGREGGGRGAGRGGMVGSVRVR